MMSSAIEARGGGEGGREGGKGLLFELREGRKEKSPFGREVWDSLRWGKEEEEGEG